MNQEGHGGTDEATRPEAAHFNPFHVESGAKRRSYGGKREEEGEWKKKSLFRFLSLFSPLLRGSVV